jgi:uncharacterized protein (DUF2062 family)
MKFSAKRAKNILYDAFSQGLTPRKLAITCALGIVVGLFPIFGTTTILCFAVAIMFHLNIPVIQLVNYLVAPLQLVLIIPFIKLGTILFDLNPLPYDAEQLAALFKNDFLLLLKEAGLALLLGIGVWAIFAVPLFFIVYHLFFFGFRRWLKQPHREL